MEWHIWLWKPDQKQKTFFYLKTHMDRCLQNTYMETENTN